MLFFWFFFISWFNFFLLVASKDIVLEVKTENYVFVSREQNAGEYRNV